MLLTSLQFTATNTSLAAIVSGTFEDPNPLANVTVLGVKAAPTSVKFNGKALEEESWEYAAASSVLSITELGRLTAGGTYNANWTVTWS